MTTFHRTTANPEIANDAPTSHGFGVTPGTAIMIGYSPKQMSEHVRRDLEDLLNTRKTGLDVPEDLTEARQSLLTYGLPDLLSLEAITPQQRAGIARITRSVAAWSMAAVDMGSRSGCDDACIWGDSMWAGPTCAESMCLGSR